MPQADPTPPLLATLALGIVLAGGNLVSPPPCAGAASSPTAAAAEAAVAEDPASLLPGGREPRPGLLTGGQPSLEQLQALAAAGYRTYVTLRDPTEAGQPTAEAVEALGLRHVRIPVGGPEDLGEGEVGELASLLADPEASPLLVTCGSGNRVGALLALEAAQVEGLAPEAALELGLAAGLTRLEPVVRERLELPAAADAEE